MANLKVFVETLRHPDEIEAGRRKYSPHSSSNSFFSFLISICNLATRRLAAFYTALGNLPRDHVGPIGLAPEMARR